MGFHGPSQMGIILTITCFWGYQDQTKSKGKLNPKAVGILNIATVLIQNWWVSRLFRKYVSSYEYDWRM